MDRTLFDADHDTFRTSFRQFVERDIRPHQERWREQGQVDRAIWRTAGAHGFLCPVIVMEELARAYESGFAMSLHSDIVVPYLYSFGTDEQKQRWLPGCASGELVTALGMTEPGTGSDLAALATTAVRDGDHYVLNGQKTFISNGQLCDLVIVVARTDPEAGYRGISLLAVERGTGGFERGRNLDKIGMHAQDTSELFFSDVRVPAANLLGEEGGGFVALMQNLPRERVAIGTSALAGAEGAFDLT